MRRKPASDWNEKIDTVCLGDWAELYLDTAKSRFSEKTYHEKCSVFRRLFRGFDPAMTVSEFKPSHAMTHILQQKEARSGYAANKDRKNLVAGWNWGMKYMDPPLPGPNPCLVDRMPEIRNPRYVPPEEDFWKIFETAEGQDKVMLLAFLHLAGRRGEIFRITWSDVDFGNNRMRLWTRKRMGGIYEYDWLPMTAELRESLRWWWEQRPIKDSPYVFLSVDESECNRENYGKPFKYRQHFMRKFCDEAKVKRFGFHSIRHLTASILYNLGYGVAVIQAILRHRSPGTTERYLKSIGIERVRDALEDLSREKAKVIELKPKKRGRPKSVSKKQKAV